MPSNELIDRHLDSLSTKPTKILDVGGGASPYPKATEILDLFDHDFVEKFSYGDDSLSAENKTWTKFDICSRELWPYGDDTFDFSICSHTLEDIKDPLWVCKELARISKAGYIEFPSRYQESIHGLVYRGVTGWPHHRWMIEERSGNLLLIPKLHHMNTRSHLSLPKSFRNHEDASHTSFFWHGSFKVFELLIYVEDNQREYIAQFESSRNRLFFIRRWLRNVVRRMYGHQETISPSYMWIDASAHQYGPYMSIHEGPCT